MPTSRTPQDKTPPVVGKAIVYITYQGQLLVFSHTFAPEAGLQVPGGTIRPGETPARAALREAEEETGWGEFGYPSLLGNRDFDCRPFGKAEIHARAFFHLAAHGTPPGEWRHWERDPEGAIPAVPIEFNFFWLPLERVQHRLIADQGALVPELLGRLGY